MTQRDPDRGTKLRFRDGHVGADSAKVGEELILEWHLRMTRTYVIDDHPGRQHPQPAPEVAFPGIAVDRAVHEQPLANPLLELVASERVRSDARMARSHFGEELGLECLDCSAVSRRAGARQVELGRAVDLTVSVRVIVHR